MRPPHVLTLVFVFVLVASGITACPVCNAIARNEKEDGSSGRISSSAGPNPETKPGGGDVFVTDPSRGSLSDPITLTRHVRRMQPDAVGAITGPDRPLEWGSLNFLHTTDTHGWLSGHLKEQNYGADWGDWISFVNRMRRKADTMGVDLLVVDTGDLHDGNGLTDVTAPNGWLAMKEVWEKMGPARDDNEEGISGGGNGAGYDVLTIGNHELYVADVTYYHFENFTRVFGDRYLTSNVQVRHPETKQFVDIGRRYRYFETKNGVRIMAFGVLFDFNRASNATRVTPATEMVKEHWFQDAISDDPDRPVDLFLLLGHNPTSPLDRVSTFKTVTDAIRERRKDVPIQVFGGHSHVRDFTVYDNRATGLNSGQYCETVGWLAIDGVNSSVSAAQGRFGSRKQSPRDFGYPTPARPAVPVNLTRARYYRQYAPPSRADPVYARRYLDWNRVTLEWHSQPPSCLAGLGAESEPQFGSESKTNSTDEPSPQKCRNFDTPTGQRITDKISQLRHDLNLTTQFGCAPRTYCQYCQPFMAPGNIYSLVTEALATVVMRQDRKNVPRYIYINTGSIRYDLAQGPFTLDDSFIVSPFENRFVYIPDVPIDRADQVLGLMNSGPYQRRRRNSDWPKWRAREQEQETCADPPLPWVRNGLSAQSPIGPDGSVAAIRGVSRRTGEHPLRPPGHIITRRRQVTEPTLPELTPGRTTVDDFGADGDDTRHSVVPNHKMPNDVMANASLPPDGSRPATVDIVFAEFVQPYVLSALKQTGGGAGSGNRSEDKDGTGASATRTYTDADVKVYNHSVNSNTYLGMYIKQLPEWQKDLPDCPLGLGVGS